MAPTLIVLALAALGLGIVVWAVRKRPDATTTGPQEDDIAWNDPVTPGETLPADSLSSASLPEEPRP